MVRRRVVAGSLVGAGVAAASGVAWWGRVCGGGALDPVAERGHWRIGYAVEAPYAFVGFDNEVTGQSPDLAREVVRRLGPWPIDWVLTRFDRLISDLQARRFDLIAAGMFITAERAARVRFSQPTARVASGMLVPAAAVPPGDDAAWLRRAGRRVAVLSGSVEAGWWAAHLPAGGRIVPVPDPRTGMAAVEQGLADGLCLSLPTLGLLAVSRAPAHRVFRMPGPAEDGPAPGWVGFQFHRSDRSLQQAWNEAQAPVLASATYRAILARFGFAPEDGPGGTRLADLLPGEDA